MERAIICGFIRRITSEAETVVIPHVRAKLIQLRLFMDYSTTDLEKEMATHSSTLAWRIPWTEDLVGSSPWGHKESDTH